MFIREVGDLSTSDINTILARANEYRLGEATPPNLAGAIVGLIFLDASLRTRVGFASAAARLGATPVSVHDLRSSDIAAAESTQDTLRVVCGYSDVVIARLQEPFEVVPPGITTHVINGGDRGPRQEHPSQALIDLFALRRSQKPFADMTIALVGDLRMRSARSLLAMLERFPPKQIFITTSRILEVGLELPEGLTCIVERRELADTYDADVLYMVGIPDGAISERGRSELRLNQSIMESLSPTATILSPLPLIDEVEQSVRNDARMKFFRQSDEGLFVRMSILEHLLTR